MQYKVLNYIMTIWWIIAFKTPVFCILEEDTAINNTLIIDENLYAFCTQLKLLPVFSQTTHMRKRRT